MTRMPRTARSFDGSDARRRGRFWAPCMSCASNGSGYLVVRAPCAKRPRRARQSIANDRVAHVVHVKRPRRLPGGASPQGCTGAALQLHRITRCRSAKALENHVLHRCCTAMSQHIQVAHRNTTGNQVLHSCCAAMTRNSQASRRDSTGKQGVAPQFHTKTRRCTGVAPQCPRITRCRTAITLENQVLHRCCTAMMRNDKVSHCNGAKRPRRARRSCQTTASSRLRSLSSRLHRCCTAITENIQVSHRKSTKKPRVAQVLHCNVTTYAGGGPQKHQKPRVAQALHCNGAK